MKKPMMFFSCDCGGYPAVPRGCATPADPTVICDQRYYTLTTASSRGKILVVIPGSNCQAYLPSTVRGLVFSDGNGVGHYVEPTPAMNLPYVNPAVSGVVPSTGNATHLMVGTSSDPAAWKFFTAPSTGTWRLEVADGVFKFVDGTSIPGIMDIALQNTAESEVVMFGFHDTGEDTEGGDPIYALRKLNTPDKRPIVGKENLDGSRVVRALPLDEPLEHPLATFEQLNVFEIVPVDEDGEALPNFEEMPEGVSDAISLVYSPTQKKLFRLPDGIVGAVIQTVYDEYDTVGTGTTVIPADDTIPQITEGTEILSLTITPTSASSKIRISTALQVDSSTSLVIALFKDGASNAISTCPGQNGVRDILFYDTAGTTDPITYSIRIGNITAAETWRTNQTSTGDDFGGTLKCVLTAEEIRQ